MALILALAVLPDGHRPPQNHGTALHSVQVAIAVTAFVIGFPS